jgi:hypothetical protein
MSKQRWKYSVGERPYTVTVYERRSGGNLYVRVWDGSLRSGRGGWRKRSLGHRDRERAKAYAHEQHAKLRQGDEEIRAGLVTLARLLALYRAHHTPRKARSGQAEDRRRIELWTRSLGAGKDPHRITLAEWEAFQDARRSGAIDARGRSVAEGDRRPVRTRAVEGDLQWLKWVLAWGTKWRDREGRYLMRENAVRGYEIPTEKNPRRPVATQDRYEAVQAVSDRVMMDVRCGDRPELRQSYLSELLEIANGTGRRLSAICQLRYADLRLAQGPYGSIRWPADTDKTGRETVVPIGPGVPSALDRVLRERPGIGGAPLFSHPRDPSRAVTRYMADRWLREAEELAGLEPQKGSLWHAYRRKWATERKHLPDVDVAAAGGWRETGSLKRAYQQADEATMLAVVLGAGELRERKA